MGENEHGVVVGRVVAPPARPLLVAPGTARLSRPSWKFAAAVGV
jgi:hypothetical protein